MEEALDWLLLCCLRYAETLLCEEIIKRWKKVLFGYMGCRDSVLWGYYRDGKGFCLIALESLFYFVWGWWVCAGYRNR